MSIFIQVSPDSTSGLTLHVQSASHEVLEKALRYVTSVGQKGAERKFGFTKEFLDEFAKTDVFPSGVNFLRVDDEFQYDAEDNTLVAGAKLYAHGRVIQFPDDPLLKRLAEHIHLQWAESHRNSDENDSFNEERDRQEGIIVDKHITGINALLTQLLAIRMMLCSFQYLLRKKLRAYVPVLIGTDDKGKVAAFVNGSLLDPRKLKDHILQQCVAVEKEIYVGGHDDQQP